MDQDAERSPLERVGIGLIATLLAWILLAAFVNALLPHVSTPGTARALGAWANLVVFAIASFLGGLVAYQRGTPGRAREAALVGLSAAALAWGLVLVVGGGRAATQLSVLLLVVLSLVGSAASFAGYAVVRSRARRRS